MEFKNLKEQLKPQILANLEADKEKYPNSYKDIMGKLEKSIVVGQLDFNTVVGLTSYSPTPVSSILEIYGMFEE